MKELYNDMDDKSREAAGKICIAFDEIAWEKMKMLLDKDDRKSVVSKTSNILPAVKHQNQNFGWLMLAMVFFLLETGLVTTKNNYTKNYKTLSSHNNKKASDKNKEEIIMNSPVIEKKFATETSNQQRSEIYNYANKKFESQATIDSKSSLSLTTKMKFLKSKRLDSNKNTGERQTAFENIKSDLHPFYKDDLKNKTSVENRKFLKDVIDSNQQQVNIAPGINKKGFRDTPRASKTKNNEFCKNIGVSVFVSPEINSVKFRSIDKVTIGYGAGINYNIGKHFTLQAQFAKTKKVYVTDKKGYTPPAGSSLFAIDTLKVKAECKVWDIPMNIKYSFTDNTKNSFFITAGLSSYIMKKEVYDLNYYEQGVYKTKQRIIENENKHSFCNLNLFAGYQFWLNKKWSMGFEPYLKLPVNRIGTGKVKLTSAGALFSLTFKPKKANR